jgi:hypothetical protein
VAHCVNLFKQEQKEDQSFDQWHIHLYSLGEDAKVDELTGRDWLLFFLIQSCKSKFQALKQHQRQQLQQRHQQQQQQQAEECAQINSDFGTWGPFDTCNGIAQGINNVNNFCRPTPPLFLHLKPVRKPIFRIQVLADTGATRSLISLSTETKHGCKIKETTIYLSADQRHGDYFPAGRHEGHTRSHNRRRRIAGEAYEDPPQG